MSSKYQALASILCICLSIHVFQFFSLFLLPFSRRLYRAYNLFFARVFGSFLVVYAHHFCPYKLFLSGDYRDLVDDPNIILIANHQIYTDWLYIWALAWMVERQAYIRIILKNSLKYVPVLGISSIYPDN